jgi:hypothetical protein
MSPRLMNRAGRYDAVLSAADAADARRLLPPSFFEQQSTDGPRRRPDMFLHEIAVEDDGRAHAVTLSDEDIAPSLRPFVEWLQRKAGV